MSIVKEPRQHTLRHGLRAVGLIGLLLAAANFAWHVAQDVERGRDVLRQSAQRHAINASSRITYEVVGAKVLLDRFLDELRRPDIVDGGCPEVAKRLIRDAPGYLNLGFIGRDGFVVCSGVKMEGRVYVGDRPYVQEAFAARNFVSGGLQISRTTGKLSLNFALPSYGGDGEVDGLVGAATDVGYIQNRIADLALPKDTAAYVTDTEGVILARVPAQPDIVGTRLGTGGAAWAALLATGTSTLDLGTDGSESFDAFAAPFSVYADTGMHFVLAIPEQALWIRAGQDVTWPTVLISLLFVAAAIAVWILGERIVIGPVIRLAAVAERLGKGSFAERTGPPYDGNEIGTLQHAFDNMSAAIQERESRLLQAQRRARLAYWTRDLRRKEFIEWSSEAAAILGVEPDRLPRSDREHQALVHPDDRARVSEVHAGIGSDLETFTTDYRIVQSNGQIAWLREVGEVKTSAAGERIHAIGTIQDVTSLMETRRSRDEVEGRLRAFMDHAPFVMYVKDLDGRYLLANLEHTRVFGDPDKPILDGTADEARAPEMAALIAEHDSAVLDSGRTVIRERSYEGRATYHQVMVVKFPVLDEDGRIVAIGGFEIDIGDRKRIERQLFRAQKMEAIGQLTGGLAHDFNNICGVIIGNLDLLQEMVADDADAGGLVKEALDATLRGSELNRRLLAFSRRQPLQPKTIDVRETIDGMSMILHRTLGETTNVRTSIDPDCWPIIVDVAQLESAILNLAVNARDAMPEGGTLTVEIENAHLDAEYLGGHPDVSDGDFVRIAVSDSGTGMAPEALARAFEPFFTTKEQGKGTGLGLAMVDGFVRQSGGHATIYSEVGRGTTVKLYFRRAEQRRGSEHKPVSVPSEVGGGETILVVEDNEGMRNIVQRQLRELGYRTIEAESPKAALDILRGDEPIDLLLTDMIMPGGMDGLGLAVEAPKLRQGIKVMFTSGFTEAAASAQASELIDRLLTKPYRKAALANMVRRVLDTD